jgi:hypothetical protein
MITNQSGGFTKNQILAAARMLGEHFYPNCVQSPNWILVPAIRELARLKRRTSPEDLFESFVAESEGKYRKHLHQFVAAS